MPSEPILHRVLKWVRKPRPVQTILALMGLALVVPAVLFQAYLVSLSAAEQRAQVERRLEQMAADLADSLDREIERMLTLLNTLALSQQLANHDLSVFHAEASAAVQRLGTNVLVIDASGQQLLNTRVPYGTPLPVTSDKVSLQEVLETDHPLVSNVIMGAVARKYVFSIYTPLNTRGDMRQVVLMSIDADHLVALMRGMSLPPEWIMGISDRNGTVVARSKDQGLFVGKALPAELLQASREHTGAFATVSMAGVPSLRAVARSKLSGWLVSANVPLAVVNAQIRQSEMALVLGGISLLIFALALASLFARWIIDPFHRLAAAAALGRPGDASALRLSSPVAEANEISAAMRAASLELKSRLERLQESERRLNLAQRTARLAYVDVDLQRDIVTVSDTFEEIFGFRPPTHDAHEAAEAILGHVHPQDRERIRQARARAVAQPGSLEDEFRIVLPDGGIRWIAAHGETLADANGAPIRMIGTNLDITRRKEQESHIRSLLREVSHRSKNLLAIIQAMAAQTARTSPTYEVFQVRFGQRLQGMAASHDLLVNQNWIGVDLAELVRAQLLPFEEQGEGRVQIDGPRCLLKPVAAQAIGLAVHELATNATKHGALSAPEGRVSITWSYVPDGTGNALRLVWKETGGPQVDSPSVQGFGRTVLERLTSQALNAKAELSYPREGVTWTLEASLDAVVQGREPRPRGDAEQSPPG